MQGQSWEASQSISHGGALPYSWMIENSLAGASAGKQEGEPGAFLQLFRTEAVCRQLHLPP